MSRKACLLAAFLMLTLALPAYPRYDPSQRELTPILRKIKKNPTSPEAWYSLATFAYRHQFYADTVQIGLVASETTRHQDSSTRSKQRVTPADIAKLIEQAAEKEAGLIIAAKERRRLTFHDGYSDLNFQELRLLLERRVLPKKYKRRTWNEEREETPPNYSSDYEALLLATIRSYRDLNLSRAAQILEEDLNEYRSERLAYEFYLSHDGKPSLPSLLSLAQDAENRFALPAKRSFIDIALKNAIARAKREKNTRFALHELLVWRHRLDDDRSFDSRARDLFIDYLGHIRFTTQDIFLEATAILHSSDYGFLGSVNTRGRFASVAKAGEMVYMPRSGPGSGFWLRGFVTHKRIAGTPVLLEHETDAHEYHVGEIWGDYYRFLDERDMTTSELFTDEPPEQLPQRYTPLTLVSEETNAIGGLLGAVSDFIDEHPIASALIAGTALYMMTDDQRSTDISTENSSDPLPDFGLGNLYLFTGSICGEGTISVRELTTGEKRNLECCGWGNLGAKSWAFSPGSYELDYVIRVCGGTHHGASGLSFEIRRGQTTNVEISLDSGTYHVSYRE